MNSEQNIDERIWSYIDGSCSEAEKLFIEQLVTTNATWKAQYQELLELHQLLNNNLELDEPSMRFTQNVMEQISQYHIAPATRTYLNKHIIQGIAAFFILTILGFFIYGVSQVNWSPGESSSLDPFGKISFDKIDFSKLMHNTWTYIFMMTNVVLGLVWLDMYLNRRKMEAGSRK
jgi:hypothetical protein